MILNALVTIMEYIYRGIQVENGLEAPIFSKTWGFRQYIQPKGDTNACWKSERSVLHFNFFPLPRWFD